MTIHFISDLHLSAQQPKIIALFQQYLATQAMQANTLYILGDLFDAWAGDDISAADISAVSHSLRQYSASGRALKIMRGNRDFLLTDDYCTQVGAKLLPDPLVVNLAGTPTLLSHGDQYCTDDISYQRFRRIVQHPAPQAIYYRSPAILRQRLVDYLRSGSQQHKQQKSHDIMDVNTGAIDTAFNQFGVNQMIHGHTHRPAMHEHNGCKRIVLGDWFVDHSGQPRGYYLQLLPNGELKPNPL